MTTTTRIPADSCIMVTTVFPGGHQSKIRKTVVRLISVNVMNKLKPAQRTPKFLRHNPTMKPSPFTLSRYIDVSTRFSVTRSRWSVRAFQPTDDIQPVVARRTVSRRKQLATTSDTLLRRFQCHVGRTLTHIFPFLVARDTLRSRRSLCVLGDARTFSWIAVSPPAPVVHPTPAAFLCRPTTNLAHGPIVASNSVPVNLDAMDL